MFTIVRKEAHANDGPSHTLTEHDCYSTCVGIEPAESEGQVNMANVRSGVNEREALTIAGFECTLLAPGPLRSATLAFAASLLPVTPSMEFMLPGHRKVRVQMRGDTDGPTPSDASYVDG